MQIRATIKLSCLGDHTFINMTLKSFFKSLFTIECRACSNNFPFSFFFWSQVYFSVSFISVLNKAMCAIKAQQRQQCEVGDLDKPSAVCSGEARHLGKHCSPMICHQLWKPASTWSLLSAHKRKCLKLI